MLFSYPSGCATAQVDQTFYTVKSGSVCTSPGISPPAAHVLVIDDEPGTRQTITSYFTEHHFRVALADGHDDALRAIAQNAPSVILLDPMLAAGGGLDLLREIRSRSDVPIIIVTAQGKDEADRVVGLELGADDYMTKPFGLRELLARVRAVLRRCQSERWAPPREQERGVFRFAGWQLDRRRRELHNAEGAPVPLTRNEYTLLVAFLEAPGRPLSREHLLNATRMHEDVFDRSIDVQVLRLRRRLERDPGAPELIVTERGVGYRLAVPVECVRP